VPRLRSVEYDMPKRKEKRSMSVSTSEMSPTGVEAPDRLLQCRQFP